MLIKNRINYLWNEKLKSVLPNCFCLQNSSSSPSVNGSRVRFWEDFFVFYPKSYKRTASGEKQEKIPKYDTDKYRSGEHITPLHLRPICRVVYEWTYSFEMMGYLILRCASRLDTFSVYHICTRLCSINLQTKKASLLRNPTKSSSHLGDEYI